MPANYHRPPFSPAQKSTPRVTSKVKTERVEIGLDRKEKEAVRQRDHESCRVCFRKSREVNERVMKSRGGTASLDNSCVMCRLCHRLFHGKAIKILGPTCNGPLEFVMHAKTAHLVFRGKAAPPHVHVVVTMETDG